MSAYGMGQKAGLHVLETEDFLQRHKDVYHNVWRWAEQNVNAGLASDDIVLDADAPHIKLVPHPWRRLKTKGSGKAGAVGWGKPVGCHETSRA